MLRSLVCYDIQEEGEELTDEESDDVHGSSCESTSNSESNTSSWPHLLSEERTKRLVETAQNRLTELNHKRLQPSHKKSSSFYGQNKQIKEHGSRKRKIDVGDRLKRNDQSSEKTSEVSTRFDSTVEKKEHQLPVSKIIKSSNKVSKLKNVDKVVLEHLKEQDFVVKDVYDPHGSKKSRIEKDLDEAIEQKDFELAQKISDEMSERKLSTRIQNNFAALTYLEKKKIEKETQEKKKKKLNWMFDHKERWEVKGNM